MKFLTSESLGTIHIIGIAGIGMSGIAEILHNLGYKVQGSDITENDNIIRLKKLGIKIYKDHSKENIKNVAVIVRSTAIKDNNPEIIEAQKKSIPVIPRSEMLMELMRSKFCIAVSGTHGKTTTTSLVALTFDNAKLNPTVINGGIIVSKGTNAYLGESDYLILEADESDGTFIKVPSTVAVITNIDAEHLDYYKTFDNLKLAFKNFIMNLPFYGFAVVCKDHYEVRNLIEDITNKEIITYGIESQDVDIRAVNIRTELGYSIFDINVSRKITTENNIIKDIKLPMYGKHNVLNSLAAIAIALKLKLKDSQIKDSFKGFEGVKRRFTKTGEVGEVVIIDDYAHHPAEITATLNTARNIVKKNIVAIVQPHRYSRLKDLFNEFVESLEGADKIVVCKVYSAGESSIEGFTEANLTIKLKQRYKDKQIYLAEDFNQLPNLINEIAKSGDLVLCMGAGDITKFANQLPEELKKLNNTCMV